MSKIPSDVAFDLRNSSTAFVKLVWPLVSNACGGGELIPIETTNGGLGRVLDYTTSIDYVQVLPNGVARGIASRVQFGQTVYKTFTVRCHRSNGRETELSKLIAAANTEGALRAYITIQAYVWRGKLLYAACAKSDDIVRMAMSANTPRKANSIDGNSFAIIPAKSVAFFEI